MKHYHSWLLALSTIVTVNLAMSNSIKAEDSKYPEEFVQQYQAECVPTSVAEGLSEEEAEKLCECTLNKFQSQYQLEEFQQLTIDSLEDEQAEAVLVEVGQVCFEEMLYEQ